MKYYQKFHNDIKKIWLIYIFESSSFQWRQR